METIYSSAEEGQTSAYENFVNSFEGVGQEYLKNRFILSNFTTLIQGAAGTGKTSGVLNLVITLLEDCNYLGVVPSEGQVEGLGDSIATEDVYIKDEFFKKLGIDQIDHNLQSDVSTDRATEEQINQILKMDSLVEGENKFIIIDEFSLFTAAELELLSKYAKKHGIIVLLAGDFKQNKATVSRTYTEGNKTITTYTPHSTDDCVIFSTPELITSMRAANVAKQMNLIAMQSVMDPVYDTLTVDPTYSVDKINKDLTGKHVNLVYTDDSSGTLLAGEKIITPSKDNKNIFVEIDNILKRDTSKTSSLCIVAEEDKKEFYENHYQDDPRVTVLPKLNSQGQEFDYVVVDISDAGALFDNLSAYYTAAQRSRLATLIVSEKDSLFTSEHFDRGANAIKTDDQFISRMQEWFLKAFA
jgi:archaellum biogenesis ATPase FlaH